MPPTSAMRHGRRCGSGFVEPDGAPSLRSARRRRWWIVAGEASVAGAVDSPVAVPAAGAVVGGTTDGLAGSVAGGTIVDGTGVAGTGVAGDGASWAVMVPRSSSPNCAE